MQIIKKMIIDFNSFIYLIAIFLKLYFNFNGKFCFLISKIFVNGLKQLDVYKRPIHCSDLKREVLYIKDQDNWEKDDDKTHLLQAIKVVGNKNIKQISEWQKINPQFKDPESKQNDKYLSMLCNVMSGGTQEETSKNYDKIVRNIVKETVIDK